jgi:NAD(P)-dependent dehydrogenase (short-subunit alcohol dehydrogenase family)
MFCRHFHLTNLLLPVIKSTSIRDGLECRILSVGSSLESKAMAFPGEDPTGKSALRGELPDSVQFGDRMSSADTFYGLLSGMQWMENGPSPYFMHNAYGNASLCILLTSVELSQRLAAEKSDSLVTVNVVCPGYVNTAIWKDATFWNLFRRIAFKNPVHAAGYVASVAMDPEYAGKTGQLFSSILDIKPSKMAASVELREKVWEESFLLIERVRSLQAQEIKKQS